MRKKNTHKKTLAAPSPAKELKSALKTKTRAKKISSHPNPTNGIFNFQMNTTLQNKRIEVYNRLGKIVFSTKTNNSQSDVDLSSQPNGFYFIQIKTEQGMLVKKLIIQK